MVEERERAHHPSLRSRQHASHFKAAEIAATLVNDVFDHVGSCCSAKCAKIAPDPSPGDRAMPTIPGAGIIAHAIQLAIAPVFLLTGVAGLLNVMAGRLARVIDRVRALEQTWPGLDARARTTARVEIGNLERRRRVCSWSINYSTAAALLICLVIVALFVEEFFARDLRWLAGALFVAAMVALIGGLTCFMREVYLATHMTSVDLKQFE